MGAHSAEGLRELAAALRDAPAIRAKRAIGQVSEVFGPADWYAGPGDDGAVLPAGPGDLVVGGEAILPAFVTADPYGAGIAAVLANVNDLAAMGARPLAVVDTVVGPEQLTEQVLRGMRWAAQTYDVPVVGGHLTRSDGPPALSAFGIGRATRVLSARNAAPGQTLLVAGCIEGRMRADFPFFPSFDERGSLLAGDVRLLADLAEAGAVVAAKDVSMAGLVGSLAMLLEFGGLGVEVDLSAVPGPRDVPIDAWLACFPCLLFLLCAPDGRVAECAGAFRGRGLVAEPVGVLDETGVLRLRDGEHVEPVFDLAVDQVTRLRG
jgi:selenophosphate synthetase-related protein